VALGYLGPEGTFSEEAAAAYAKGRMTIRPYPSIPLLIKAAENGEISAALAPLENSLEGSVGPTLSALTATPLLIASEVVLPIAHFLAVRPETGKPRRVLSHPHALAQCGDYLTGLDVEISETASTAAAARTVSESRQELGAICTLRAARLYGLQATEIPTCQTNMTRFIVLAAEDAPPTGHDKTSVLLSAKADRSGWLYQVLKEFAARQINLTRIESRPTGKALGHYHFFIDFEGHRSEGRVSAALEKIAQTAGCRLLGSYPAAKTDLP
jgi:prephenate dehydratase